MGIDEKKLVKVIIEIIEKGNDVEIRRNKRSGEIKIIEVKKQTYTC